ncbi:MAG: nitroreductase family protein [Flavobacteriales bacterium]
MSEANAFIPYRKKTYSPEEMVQRSRDFYEFMDERRSVRYFSDRPVPDEVIQNIVRTASTAPSGANKQPWTFCVIKDPQLKKRIREAAEEQEQKNYEERMSKEWLQDLEPLGTRPEKPYLETAPCLIIVFKRAYDRENGKRKKNYYINESVGLATGILLTAIHHAGLASLTHTPSPMGFLTDILERPREERPFLNIPVGYPAEDCVVPDLERKSLDEVMAVY